MILCRCKVFVPTLVVLLMGYYADGGDRLEIKPTLIERTYCLDPDGTAMMELRFDVEYDNISRAVVLVPRFSRVSGYRLFRNERALADNRPEYQVTYKAESMLDATKLDPSQPSPGLFDALKPGGVLHRIYTLRMAASTARQKVPSSLNGDLFLQLQINHWVASRSHGRKLAKSWKAHGELLISEMLLPAVRLRIEKVNATAPCPLRVD